MAVKEHQEIGSKINKLCLDLKIDELELDDFVMKISVIDKKIVKNVDNVPEENIKIQKIILKKFYPIPI